MPKLWELMGYIIYFWVGDGEEPVHVHVSRRQHEHATKFWITENGISLANNNDNIPQKDLRRIAKYIEQNQDYIIASLHLGHAYLAMQDSRADF